MCIRDRYGIGAHFLGHLGSEHLGHRRLGQAGLAGIFQHGGAPGQQSGCVDLGGHIGQAKTDGLVVDDRRAKGFALLGILYRRFEGRTRHAHRLRGNSDAPGFEVGERNAIALAFRAKQSAGRNTAVLENDLRGIGSVLSQLFLDTGNDISGHIGRHQEAGNSLFTGRLVGDREDDRGLCVLAGRDELLDTCLLYTSRCV